MAAPTCAVARRAKFKRMKLLVINPNTTQSITDVIEARACQVAAAGTEIIAVTAPFGAAYIETKEQSATAVDAMRALIDDHRGKFDAAVICSSSDSGLHALRKHIDAPVTAMTESALTVAAMRGNNCTIMVYGSHFIDGMFGFAEACGFEGLVNNVRVPCEFDGGTPPNATEFAAAFVVEGKRAIAEDGADVIYAGGSAASMMTAELTKSIGVPVVEGISCAVKMAEALATLR